MTQFESLGICIDLKEVEQKGKHFMTDHASLF